MYHITQEDVLAFVAGAVTNTKLCAAIEEARDTNPQVQYWFDLYDPDGNEEEGEACERQPEEVISFPLPPSGRPREPIGVHHRGGQYVSEHRIPWKRAAKNGGPKPAPLNRTVVLPLHLIDPVTGVATLKYEAEKIPLGVARVTAKRKNPDAAAGGEFGSTLVVFRLKRRKERWIRVAEVSLEDLGDLIAAEPLAVELCVTEANPANLAAFPLREVQTLRDACNGDLELRGTVEKLIDLLETQAL